ncbi:hypothetical protein H4I95_09758 [Botrytis cinerea]
MRARLYSQEACNLPDGEYRKLLAEIEKKYNEYDTASLFKPLDALYILYYSSSNIRDIDAIYKGAHADNHPLNQELRQKTNPDTTGIFLFDPDRVNAVASIVLLATVPALFIIPVCTLWYLCQIKLISLFTCAKSHQVLAATAAYFAVLVLFIGNIETIKDMLMAV